MLLEYGDTDWREKVGTFLTISVGLAGTSVHPVFLRHAPGGEAGCLTGLSTRELPTGIGVPSVSSGVLREAGRG